MNFEEELKKKKMNIRNCSEASGIPYATLYPIIKGQTEIGSCSYNTVAKLAATLGYRPDEIVYYNIDFQTFRNDLHHDIKRDELKTVMEIISKDQIEYYRLHQDYIKALYLVATVDYLSKKNDIPLCDKYEELRKMKLDSPVFIGDSAYLGTAKEQCIPEYVKYNIFEGNIYDAV